MIVFCYNVHKTLTKKELSFVSAKRQERALSYKFEKDRLRCLAAGYLLSSCLFIDEDRLMYGENNKPLSPLGCAFFNLSHAGDYVVLAAAKNEVGVDIEPVERCDIDVAKRCFTSMEYAWLISQNTNEAFFKLWTAKESIMKATGKGFSLAPEHFEVPLHPPFVCIVEQNLWHINSLTIDAHVLSTAVQNEPENVELVFVSK